MNLKDKFFTELTHKKNGVLVFDTLPHAVWKWIKKHLGIEDDDDEPITIEWVRNHIAMSEEIDGVVRLQINYNINISISKRNENVYVFAFNGIEIIFTRQNITRGWLRRFYEVVNGRKLDEV